MNWRKQGNGEYQFNINRTYQGDTIRVQFPLYATVSEIKEYLRHYTYPNDQVYESSSCVLCVGGIGQRDDITVADLKYKKLYGYIECPIHITRDSNWITDDNGCFTFRVGLPHQREIVFKMRPDTMVDKLRTSVCQRQGVPDFVICGDGVPISDHTTINTIQHQYININ